MITRIDYGLGNIKAFVNVYKHLNIAANVATNCDDLRTATKVIMPGVGSFDYAMERLEKSGMHPALDEIVLSHHVPILGICVGMQMLACSSEEGNRAGLGWLDGEVKRFYPSSLNRPIRVPHMGWNTIESLKSSALLQGIDDYARFYFLHSYYFNSHRNDDVLSSTDYYGEFASAVNSGNVFGVQFHPEKSHQWGIQLLKNFSRL